MEDGRIKKDLFHGELTTGSSPVGRPALSFKDVCKRDLKLTGIDTGSWEALADDRHSWRPAVQTGVYEDIQGYTRVYRGIQGYTRVYRGIRGYTGVYKDIQGYTRVSKGTQGYTRVYSGFQGFTMVCKDIQGYTRV